MIKNLNRRFLVLSVIVSFIALAVLISASSISPKTIHAQGSGSGTSTITPIPTAILGWMWSSNIGWISANSNNPLSGGGSYRLEKQGDGRITGYAWSSNIGWIKFGGLSGFPTNGIDRFDARVNGGAVQGWARACAGTTSGTCSTMASRTDGWDGWIALTDVSFSPITGAITGWAWGSDVVGWISLNLAAGPTPPEPETCPPTCGSAPIPPVIITGTPTVIETGNDPVCLLTNGVGVSTNYTISNYNPAYTYHYSIYRNTILYGTANKTWPASASLTIPWTEAGAYYLRVWASDSSVPPLLSGSANSTTVTVQPCGAELKITLKVHDDRYGDRMNTADVAHPNPAAPAPAKIRKGIPFDLIGTLDTSQFTSYSLSIDNDPQDQRVFTDDVIDTNGKKITQTKSLVRYKLDARKTVAGTPPTAISLSASLDVLLVDPDIEER